MAGFVKYIMKALAVAVFIPSLAFGVQAQNPRSAKTAVSRNQAIDTDSSVRRSATSVISRSAATNGRGNTNGKVISRSAVSRAGTKISVAARSNSQGNSARSKNTRARTATSRVNKPGMDRLFSRAGRARKTERFDDITKIGGSYSECHDAYATCMDQFCAVAADTEYGRCYCSDRYTKFRETKNNLTKAAEMLVDLEINNLAAVDKTADEVKAMYKATAGEAAIRKDTSDSQKGLDEIEDLLSGNTSTASDTSTTSLGVLNFGELTDLGDIWSDDGSDIFGTRRVENMSAYEGQALYTRAAKQCAEVVSSSCPTEAMFNLSASAYSVFITQDCNYVNRAIEQDKLRILESVQKMEKDLRAARLKEYQNHNSQDVNDCVKQVEEYVTSSQACDTRYRKCLDYTGNTYVNEEGTPIPSSKFFNLTKIAPVLEDIDVVGRNSKWNSFLDRYKIVAAPALDKCRNISDTVWQEFKRMAIIRIAQEQDELIQKVKDTCVESIKTCYNSDTGSLTDIESAAISTNDGRYNTAAGRAVATRGLCYEEVLKCAALYGDPNGCTYNRNTRKIEAKAGAKCGMEALLAYVDMVDTASMVQACEQTVKSKALELCSLESTTDTTDDDYYDDYDNTTTNVASNYPLGCTADRISIKDVYETLMRHAELTCAIDMGKADRSNVNVKDETALNMTLVKGAAWEVFYRLCLSLGYSEKDCKAVADGTYSGTTVNDDTSSDDGEFNFTPPILNPIRVGTITVGGNNEQSVEEPVEEDTGFTPISIGSVGFHDKLTPKTQFVGNMLAKPKCQTGNCNACTTAKNKCHCIARTYFQYGAVKRKDAKKFEIAGVPTCVNRDTNASYSSFENNFCTIEFIRGTNCEPKEIGNDIGLVCSNKELNKVKFELYDNTQITFNDTNTELYPDCSNSKDSKWFAYVLHIGQIPLCFKKCGAKSEVLEGIYDDDSNDKWAIGGHSDKFLPLENVWCMLDDSIRETSMNKNYIKEWEPKNSAYMSPKYCPLRDDWVLPPDAPAEQ